MSFDNEARKKGFNIGISNELYTVALNRNSSLYLEKIAGYWVAWRENYVADRTECVSHKTIVESRNFEYSLKKAAEYLEYIRKFQKRK